eukprot:684860-Pleurochrysis_carterae.AAC.2
MRLVRTEAHAPGEPPHVKGGGEGREKIVVGAARHKERAVPRQRAQQESSKLMRRDVAVVRGRLVRMLAMPSGL